MQKDATLSLRIDSELKSDVEAILKALGIPMTTAINMYFNQIKMRNGIPFSPVIVNQPKAYSDCTEDELLAMAKSAIDEHNAGASISEAEVYKRMQDKFKL